MTLTALVAAYDIDGDGLSATRPLAGVTLVEHQLRRLAAAGAEHPVLLVEQMAPALAAPLARLRADGIAVVLATHLADAADRLAAHPRVLILADACLPDLGLIERLATASVPAVAIVPDLPEHAEFERIDAAERWAGIALIDGRRIAEVAAMVGDWDPISTMLRTAIQDHAARIDAGREVPVLAGTAAARREAEARLMLGSREARASWAGRYIETPIAEALLPQLFARSVQPALPAIASAVLAIGGALAGAYGGRWWALGPLLLAGPFGRMGERLALIQARRLRGARQIAIARVVGQAGGAVGLGAGLVLERGQWGWLLASAVLIAAVAALGQIRRLLAWAGAGDLPAWLATPAALTWSLAPFALAGRWDAGLGALTAYAAGSFAWGLVRLRKLAG